MKVYTQEQLERLLGVGEWWNMQFASDRIGNISQSDLRETIFNLPRGINGVHIVMSKKYPGNEEFMFLGTHEQTIKRLKTSRIRLEFELRKASVQAFPSIMRSIRSDICRIDRNLRTLRSQNE